MQFINLKINKLHNVISRAMFICIMLSALIFLIKINATNWNYLSKIIINWNLFSKLVGIYLLLALNSNFQFLVLNYSIFNKPDCMLWYCHAYNTYPSDLILLCLFDLILLRLLCQFLNSLNWFLFISMLANQYYYEFTHHWEEFLNFTSKGTWKFN